MALSRARTARQSVVSRQRIIDATLDLATEHGYGGTSIAMIAQRSGLPASSIYWHFGSKDLLFADAVQTSFERWAEVPLWRPPTPACKVDHEGHLYATIWDSYLAEHRDPRFWRLGMLLVLEGTSVEPKARQRFIDLRRAAADIVRAYFEAVLHGAVRAHDPALCGVLAEHVMATWDGTCLAAYLGADLDLERHAAMTVAALLADIRAACEDGQPLWRDEAEGPATAKRI